MRCCGRGDGGADLEEGHLVAIKLALLFSGYVLTFCDATFYLFSAYITLSCLTYCVLLQTQRDTTGLTTENRELKLRLQSMEEQAKLRDGMLCSFFETFLVLLVVIIDCS